MKNTLKMLGIIAIAALIGLCLFAVVGCNHSTGPSGPPSSVSDYASLEPAMADNPNRAVARAGGTTNIGIPDYLRASVQTDSRAVLTATFAVHSDDTAIAQIVSQDGTTCKVKGLQLGSARIIVTVGSQSATLIIAVTPSASLYTLPAASVKTLGTTSFYNAWWTSNKPDTLPSDYENYRADPTYQLAWNWRNKSSSYGMSGTNCGIDILSYYVDPVVTNRRGWVRTTYGFGGWHYDLNGVTSNMTDGVQVNGDVRLALEPEFIYDNGIIYLQITHKLTNTGTTKLTGQKFGASADVMIFDNDDAPLTHLAYGALMTDEDTYGGIHYLPTMKLRLVCQNVQGISNVSTLWLGTYPGERNHVYEDKRDDVENRDSALNFSYQNITLDPGQTKSFVIRYTQVQ